MVRKDEKDLPGLLQKLGFRQHEALAYIALVRCGVATAYEIAKESSLPTANAYKVVRNLIDRGAAAQVSARPAQYVATPPHLLLEGIAEDVDNLCREANDRFANMESQAGREYVLIFDHPTAIAQKIRGIIRGAQSQLIIKGSDEHVRPYQDDIEQVAQRGVRVLIVYYGDEPLDIEMGDHCRMLPHEGNGVRLGMGPDFLTVETDYSKAIIANMSVASEAAYSENPSFVYMVDVLLKHEIYLAEIMDAMGDDIERKFGPALYDLRRRYNLNPLGPLFENYVKRRSAELGAPRPRARKPARAG